MKMVTWRKATESPLDAVPIESKKNKVVPPNPAFKRTAQRRPPLNANGWADRVYSRDR